MKQLRHKSFFSGKPPLSPPHNIINRQQLLTNGHNQDNMAAKFLILTAFIAVANADEDPCSRSMKNPDLLEGDMFGVDHIQARNAVTKKSQLWPNGVIPYFFDKGFAYKKQVLQAMQNIEENTCIKFQESDGTQTDVLRIYYGKPEDCFSCWGKIGSQQPISLGNRCGSIGIALHELVHTIGFEHEHNRSDRDDYLTINWNNIEEGEEKNFKKLLPHQNRLIGEFDFDSVMLYDDTIFSNGVGLKTMVPKQPGVTWLNVEKKKSLSLGDIKKINELYKCNEENNGTLK